MHNPKFKNYLNHPVTKRVLCSGPKRILALDGGGVRGALSIGVLEKIEDQLRHKFDNPSLVLSDYYDMIGGTSTGAIIASQLAQGKDVAHIKELYLRLGNKIFSKKRKPYVLGPLRYFLSAEYDERILEEYLHNEVGDMTLGSDQFVTGLAMFSKRSDTYNTWAFHNHPRNAYYEENKMLKVKDLLRATSAAPSFFKSKKLVFGDGSMGYFIDGGVSMVNNPSLMLFMITTIKGYGYEWKKGANNLLITSVGTGYKTVKLTGGAVDKLANKKTYSWASELPDLFMKDADELNQFVLQYFSKPMIPQYINAEARDLDRDLISDEPLLQYCRYNIRLEDSPLRALGLSYDEGQLASLNRMDHGHNVKELYKIGTAFGKNVVDKNHFPPVFDYGITSKNAISDQKEVLERFLPILKAKGTIYSKYQTVKARQAIQKEDIVSITKYGIESKNTADKGDYIIQNMTEQKEEYVIKEPNFARRYKRIKSIDDLWSLYQPIGKVLATELTSDLLTMLNLAYHFNIMTVWGELQYVTKGDFIVCPLDHNEIYRIARSAFYDTYHLDLNIENHE